MTLTKIYVRVKNKSLLGLIMPKLNDLKNKKYRQSRRLYFFFAQSMKFDKG